MQPTTHLSSVQSRVTLQDRVYLSLRSALMAGEFAPGERLTPKAISSWTDTSIMPVREALRRLTSEAALESLPNGGIRVPILTPKTLLEITEIRLLVEPLAAKKAAKLATKALIDQLWQEETTLNDAIAIKDTRAEAQANERFHFAIYRHADSIELLKTIENLWLRVGPSLISVLHRRDQIEQFRKRVYVEHHENLIRALEKKRPADAARALAADLKCGANILAVLESE